MGAQAFRAFAPGGIGNIGPGLDILGCAVTGPGDQVIARARSQPGVIVADPGHPELPTAPDQNAAAIAAAEVLRLAGFSEVGLVLRVQKGLPLAGGQGGSAASAVAGAVATNALLGSPLDTGGLLEAALAAETRVAGRHADNLAPALLGGIVLIHGMDPLDIVPLPVPSSLRIVLACPSQRLATASARAVLPRAVDRETAVRQAAHVALMIVAFTTGDLSLLRRAVHDEIAEPARAPLLPGFFAARSAAFDAGALGVSISGAGPTSFAFADSDDAARRIAAAMVEGYRSAGVVASARIERIDERGAYAEPVETGTAAEAR
jgi:homoserine kinase